MLRDSRLPSVPGPQAHHPLADTFHLGAGLMPQDACRKALEVSIFVSRCVGNGHDIPHAPTSRMLQHAATSYFHLSSPNRKFTSLRRVTGKEPLRILARKPRQTEGRWFGDVLEVLGVVGVRFSHVGISVRDDSASLGGSMQRPARVDVCMAEGVGVHLPHADMERRKAGAEGLHSQHTNPSGSFLGPTQPSLMIAPIALGGTVLDLLRDPFWNKPDCLLHQWFFQPLLRSTSHLTRSASRVFPAHPSSPRPAWKGLQAWGSTFFHLTSTSLLCYLPRGPPWPRRCPQEVRDPACARVAFEPPCGIHKVASNIF